ncbi:MAG TPA: hypothetical protein VGL58_03220 [Caulobacteraceae bacterium]|jgi:hypothetical protein
MLTWNGQFAQDLSIAVDLGGQGLGVFALESFSSAGVYAPLGARTTAAPDPQGAVTFAVASAALAVLGSPLVARLKIIGASPAAAALPVWLSVSQSGAVLAAHDGTGAVVATPVRLSPDLPYNAEQLYDFLVWLQ